MTLQLSLNYYITKPGESLREIAQRFCKDRSPAGMEQYLQALRFANQTNFLENGMVGVKSFVPLPTHSTVILPDNVGKITKTGVVFPFSDMIAYNSYAKMSRYANKQSITTRKRLATVIDHYDLEVVGAVSLLAEEIKNNRAHISDTTLKVSSALGGASADYVKEGGKKIYEQMLNVEQKLQAYLNAPHGQKTAAKQAYFKAHGELKEVFNKQVNHVSQQLGKKLNKAQIMTNRQTLLNKGRLHPDKFKVTDTDTFKTITRTVSIANVVSKIFIGLELWEVTKKTQETYKSGGDWEKELAEGVGGMALGYAASSIVLLLIGGSLCWFIVIPAVVIASLGGNWAGNQLGELTLELERQLTESS